MYFKVKVSGEPQPIVTWYYDGEPVRTDYSHEIGADGSLAIPSTVLKHSGVYKAVVANEYGSEEREVKLTVYEEGGTQSMDAAIRHHVVSSRPIPIPEFGKYVAKLHANSNQAFKDLYQVCVTFIKSTLQAYTEARNKFSNDQSFLLNFNIILLVHNNQNRLWTLERLDTTSNMLPAVK